MPIGRTSPSKVALDRSSSSKDGCVSAPPLTQNLRIQSSGAICSQIPGLSRNMDGPSRTEASSSPWRPKGVRIRSYKAWWMAAVKRQLHGVCQGPSHRLSLWKVLQRPAQIYQKGWSLTRSAFREDFSPRVIKREDQAWQQTISWESCQVITHSVRQNIYCLMKLSLSAGKQSLDRCAGGGVEGRWARRRQSKKTGKNFKL